MTNTPDSKPIDTIRDGSLKATIWKRFGDNGNFYSVEISRTWRDDEGKYHDSHSFTGSELLRVSRLADIAYSETRLLRDADRKSLA
ncbi:MAG: hypothetical protein CL958_03040 [Euryarchaeota archaeon]|nr:hypothetical protein [Porticoccaceae bacterium]MBE02057.1 hypothetical protein [Marinobacter sp.]|tara:strand:+ start:19376 stop:19633 length:258 start_codon:yes stop_codon:yes gene_type:complete